MKESEFRLWNVALLLGQANLEREEDQVAVGAQCRRHGAAPSSADQQVIQLLVETGVPWRAQGSCGGRKVSETLLIRFTHPCLWNAEFVCETSGKEEVSVVVT